jgi:hypothetical protein
MLAGLYLRIGEQNRAEVLIGELMPGTAYGTSIGLAWCYGVAGQIDKSADWMEKAIELRHPESAILSFVLPYRSSTRWPELAKMLNLLQDAK